MAENLKVHTSVYVPRHHLQHKNKCIVDIKIKNDTKSEDDNNSESSHEEKINPIEYNEDTTQNEELDNYIDQSEVSEEQTGFFSRIFSNIYSFFANLFSSSSTELEDINTNLTSESTAFSENVDNETNVEDAISRETQTELDIINKIDSSPLNNNLDTKEMLHNANIYHDEASDLEIYEATQESGLLKKTASGKLKPMDINKLSDDDAFGHMGLPKYEAVKQISHYFEEMREFVMIIEEITNEQLEATTNTFLLADTDAHF